MGNDIVSKVIGVGDVCLQTNMGMQLLLKGVKHVLDVHIDLLFVHMLYDCGYNNHFGSEKWKLNKGNLVVARGRSFLNCIGQNALVSKDNVNVFHLETSLWH